jgi:hypothetical protein
MFLNPSDVRLVVLASARDVAGPVNHPHNGVLVAVGLANLVHAEIGRMDKIRPVVVMLVGLDAEFFPIA